MPEDSPRRRGRWWVAACAAAFVAYFALLVYCDLDRPESEGADLVFGDRVTVRSVAPGSASARAGLRPGDVLRRVDGRPLRDKMDWVAVASNIEFGRPLTLDVERGGSARRLALAFGRVGRDHWTTREGVDLLVVRLVQLVSLALAVLILVRRPGDAVARLGAWLLGTVGIFCVVLPFRIGPAWRSLWWPIGAILWIPFVSSLLLGALLLTFFLQFPVRRIRSRRALAAVWLPALAACVPFARYQWEVVYRPDAAFASWDGLALLLGVSIAYVALTVGVAAWSYRRLTDETERRRLRVLLAGAIVGSAAASGVMVGWWRSGNLGLFASSAMGWLFPLLLVVPGSFTYAILRHRLFDVRLIVRQGLRYALARRLLLSLVPALLLVLVADLAWHRDRTLAEIVVGRAVPYLALIAAAVLAQSGRQRWLDALDRRFFRERYDAQRILRQVADDIRDAGSLERVAGRVTAQIELALHPRFASLLLRPAGSDAFRPIASAPSGAGPDRLPSTSRLAAVARALGRPLQISTKGTDWLAARLPAVDHALVQETGIELLVPIFTEAGAAEALIALGARLSEEPYAREDEDLLQAIAGTLALLLSRDEGRGALSAAFAECARCGACYDVEEPACRSDRALLTRVNLPRVLVARYRLDRRLGHGGMGTVYEATDVALGRRVAVKVVREELVGDTLAAERFEREARTAASFAHPNVVTIHDFGITGRGRGFLVMERLEGCTLRTELDRGAPLPAERVLHILRGACAAVDAAHGRQLVHRDLKPENVFLARVEGASETAKLLDFGIAKAFRPVPLGRVHATWPGVLVGTPGYMAPEQLRGEEVSPAWDLWALATVAFEMLTGHHPFSALVAGAAPPLVPASYPVAVEGALPPGRAEWLPFFSRALAIDPGERPGTASAFYAGLEQILLS